jgi:carboxyl-terminal processing protease
MFFNMNQNGTQKLNNKKQANNWIKVLAASVIMMTSVMTVSAGDVPSPFACVCESMTGGVAAHNSGLVQTAKVDNETQMKLTYRYSNPELVSFTSGITWAQSVNLYKETAQMIDSRHVNPVDYKTRTNQGIDNLIAALGNQAFLQTSRSRVDQAKMARLVQQLEGVKATFEAKNADDALRVMNWAGYAFQSELGSNPVIVAMEFINGTLDSLDPYSSLVPTDRNGGPRVEANPNQVAAGNVVGIGVELKAEEAGARIERVYQGGGAEAAGVKRGDLVVAAGGQPLAGKTLDDMANLIKGANGSQVLLSLKRGESNPFVVNIVRKPIEIKSVSEVRMMEDGVGYVRIDKFAEDTSSLLDQALWTLHKQGMTSLVIDLRGNPGGLLTSAISLSDKFLPSGTIVSTKGRTSADNTLESAVYAQTWKTPLVVLVDRNSASASEIFAAAIQDNKRGVIVGEKSYGKGTVQTHFPLQTVNGQLKLTTAKFYSPSGREMAGQGVTPDIKVNIDRNDYTSTDLVLTAAMTAFRNSAPQNMVTLR